MNHKLHYDKIGGILFLGLLFLGMIGGLILPDRTVSTTERRTLATFPTMTIKSVMGKNFSDNLETYLLDHFPLRDRFRAIKAETDIMLLGKTDSNGYVQLDEHIFQVRTTPDVKQLQYAADTFQSIATTYFQNSNVYYGVIPDKNYFVESLPRYEDSQVNAVLENTFTAATPISLWDSVSLEDYYYTDLHARQECLLPLANTLLAGMEMDASNNSLDSYEIRLATDTFYGGYAANSAYVSTPDLLYYMENETTENSSVYDYESNTTGSIYTLDKLGIMDDYDIYLGGARALLTIENPLQENGKNLLIFRDSFGSSIAPLLLRAYEKITLVDLRYVSSGYAMNLLEEEYDDVLFLYQVQLLYNSNSMKR